MRGHADRILFAPVDPLCVAIFRVLLALMLMVDIWPRGETLSHTGRAIAGLPFLYEHVFLTRPYRLCMLPLLALFALGWRSRPIGLALFVLLLPLDLLTVGTESRQILLVTLLAFSLLPSDAGQEASAGRAAQAARAGPIWPILLIRLQLSVAYAVNALAKTTPDYLRGDVLVGLSLTRPNLLVDLSDGRLHLGPLALPVALAAVASALIEYYLAIGFWFPRLRMVTAAVGVCFHLILRTIVTIHMLDWTCVFLYLAFLLPFEAPRAPSGVLAERAVHPVEELPPHTE